MRKKIWCLRYSSPFCQRYPMMQNVAILLFIKWINVWDNRCVYMDFWNFYCKREFMNIFGKCWRKNIYYEYWIIDKEKNKKRKRHESVSYIKSYRLFIH